MATKDFITFTPSSGSGNGTVNVTASENTTENIKTTILNISGEKISKSVSIEQKAPQYNILIDNIDYIETAGWRYPMSSSVFHSTLDEAFVEGAQLNGEVFTLAHPLASNNYFVLGVQDPGNMEIIQVLTLKNPIDFPDNATFEHFIMWASNSNYQNYGILTPTLKISNGGLIEITVNGKGRLQTNTTQSVEIGFKYKSKIVIGIRIDFRTR